MRCSRPITPKAITAAAAVGAVRSGTPSTTAAAITAVGSAPAATLEVPFGARITPNAETATFLGRTFITKVDPANTAFIRHRTSPKAHPTALPITGVSLVYKAAVPPAAGQANAAIEA